MRNKCKSFLKRFLCLTLALVVAMTSSGLDVMAGTGGSAGGSSYTGTHVSNYIGKGIMGYRMYLVKNTHKQIAKGKKAADGSIKVLGASNYLLKYNKKRTKKPYKLLANKAYYSDAENNIVGKIFYSMGKKNIKALSTGVTKGRKIGSTGKLMESVMTILEDNSIIKKKNEKVGISFSFGNNLGRLGSNDSLDFSTKKVNGSTKTNAKKVFGSGANITFTNYGGGKGMTATFENGKANNTSIGDSSRAIVPAAEIRFLVKVFNKLLSSGSDEYSNDVKFVIIKQMLVKSGKTVKDLRDEAKEDNCGKLKTYLLNHYSIVIEPVVTLMRDSTKLTISYQDFVRYVKSVDSKFYVGNQLKAIVGNMGLYGTIEIRNRKKDIQNAYEKNTASTAIKEGKLSPYGYGIYRGCADIDGGTIERESSITLTRTVIPEITVSASVSTIGRSINTLGSSGNVGKDVQNSQYLLLKMHRTDFVDLGWETKGSNTGHVIAKITDRGNFVSIIPLDKLSELCSQYNMASSNNDWAVTSYENEDGEVDYIVNGITNDTNFFVLCKALTTECINSEGRVYTSSDNYATVSFNDSTSLYQIDVSKMKFKDSQKRNNNEITDKLTSEIKSACGDAFNFGSLVDSDSLTYDRDDIDDIIVVGATELCNNAQVYAYDYYGDTGDDSKEVAFTDITDAYTGVYLGFGNTGKGNPNKVNLSTFEGNELNKMLYNLDNYWHEESPLDKSALGQLDASAQGFFNKSLALDKYNNMDIPSSVDTTAWSPSYLGDSLRGLFRYEQETGIKSPLPGYQAEIDGVGTVLCYESSAFYDYAEETAFSAKFTSISTLMGALNSQAFKNAYSTDGIELCELSGQSDIGVGYVSKDANYVVGEYGSTNTRSVEAQKVLTSSYVDGGSYQDIYRCANLFEQANPNIAQSCEDAVLKISQSNLADASINLTDSLTYTAEMDGSGTAGDYNDEDLFGQGADEGSDIQPFYIKLTVNQTSRKCIYNTTQDMLFNSGAQKGQHSHYVHNCRWEENNEVITPHTKVNINGCDWGWEEYLKINFSYSIHTRTENGIDNVGSKSIVYDDATHSNKNNEYLSRMVDCVNNSLYPNALGIDSIDTRNLDVDVNDNYGKKGKAWSISSISSSSTSSICIAVVASDDGNKYVAKLYSIEENAKNAIKDSSVIEIDDDSEDDNDSDLSDTDSLDMEFNDVTDSDVGYEEVDSYISPDDLNDPNKSNGNKFGKVTEIHSNSYYEKMENGDEQKGSTANKRIATRVPIYDKLYIYDENVTDDINYLVFDYNGKATDGRYTYNEEMSIVDKVSVTKSIGNSYMHSYSTSELPSKNDLGDLEGRINNIIKGEGMKLEYIYAVPRILTRKLKGSKQWVTSTCNIPALTKETESRISSNINSFTSKAYKNRSDMEANFLKSLSNSDFGITGYSSSPYFDSEISDVSSASFSVGTWVRVGSDFSYDTSKVAMTSGQLKGYSIYYIYSRVDTSDINWNGDYKAGSVPDDSTLKSVKGKVTLKEYELNRVYDSIQNLTELHDNPMIFRKQVNFANVSFTFSINQFDVDTYNLKGTSDNRLVVEMLMSDTKNQKYSYPCIVSSEHSGILSPSYVASSGIGGSINALNTSYKVIDSSTGTLTTANFDSSIADLTTNGSNSLNLVKGNKYVLQTVNWFKQGTLSDGVNINSAIPFVPDYSINVSRHFFGDKRVLSAITSCEANANNQKWLTTLLGLSVGIKPTNRNFDVNMGMNNTTVSETVKLGDGTFGKKCSDAFRLTAGWADGLNDNTDLDAKKNNRVVEILSAHHYDYNFILRNDTTSSDTPKPNYRVAIEDIFNVSLPRDIGSLIFSGKSSSPKKLDNDNVDTFLSFVKNDTTVFDTDILHRHDYQLAQLGKPAGTIFHAGGEDNTTYHGVVLNITEYAFRYNTIYQGSKFAKNTETPKNGILEFANKTGAKLDGVEISSGSKVTNHKLGNLNGYAYGYVNNNAKRGSVGIRMKFYPEVEMLAYAYNNSMYEYGAVDKSLYNINRIPSSIPANKDAIYGLNSSCIANIDASQLQGWKTYMKLLTIGEELRKANTSELYILSVKKGRKEGSFVDSDIKGKIASDGLAAGVGDAVSVGIGVGDLPTIYAGSDVVLQADSDFTINMAGYALDLIDDGDTSIIDDDDTPIYEETDASGNKSLKTHSYKEIVSSGEDIYTKWGNQTVGGRNRDNLFNNFTDWVENNAVNEKFKVDAKLKVSNNVYSNFNISVGSVEPLTASDKRESISNHSYNVNAYTKKEYATGAYDIIKGKGILDKFASNKNTAETGCYQIKVSHGKIEKDDGGYIAMIKQLAVDYDFAEDYWAVDDEAYKKAEKIFEASGIYSSIFEAIESDNDESNKSCRVATYDRDEDGNPVKKDGKLVYKEDCYDERGNNIGVDVSNEDILGNDEHWYDERVYTMVIRRFESRPFYLKDITLSDKVDYANATTNTKIHSQLKDANVGKWYFTVYLGERDKSNTPFADYRETNNNYCGEGKIFPEISFFNPEAKNRQSSLNNAKSSGTVIMEDVWVDGADFRVPDATTGDMTAY